MDAQKKTDWTRPDEGRRVAGVSLALARRCGWSVSLVRAGLLLSAALGACVAVAGAGASVLLVVLGLAGALAYPALALLLPDARRPRRWDFASASGAILLLVLVGQAVGFLLRPHWRAARHSIEAGPSGPSGPYGWFGEYAATVGFGAKDVVLLGFFLSSGAFLWLQRRAVYRFFRSMQVGVTLVSLTTLAVGVGVLVPQIDGFEDPDTRVDLEREYQDYLAFEQYGYQKLPAELVDSHEQYQAFRWAEGYFLYHLLHLYGVGMPAVEPSPSQEAALERFGRRYGHEERDNNRKSMLAALSAREKLAEIGAFIHDHEDAFWRFFQVATVLELNRTYKSSWFASLLFLLGIAVFLNTFKGNPRSWFKLQKLGFFTVHVGLMTLLLGGFVSKLFTDRGILQLDLRSGPEDTYWRHYDPNDPAQLPFAVRLDHFARQDWKALEVYFPEEDFKTRPPRYTLWEGREIALDYVDDGAGGLRPDVEIRVLELHDRVDVGLAFVQESADPSHGIPLAEVLLRNDHEAHDGHLTHAEGQRLHMLPMEGASESYRGETLRDPRGAFRVAAAHGEDPARHFPPRPDRLGELEVSVVGVGDGLSHGVPIHLGETLTVSGGYRVRVVDATTDLDITRDRDESLHPLPLEQQPLTLAAVWVDILPPPGAPGAEEARPERRVVLQGIDPVEYGLQERFFHSDVVLNLAWDVWSAPGPPRYLLHWDEGIAPRLLAEGGDSWPIPAGPDGEPLPLPGETELVALQVLEHAISENNLTLFENEVTDDGWDADFYARSPRGAVLEVVRHPATENERVERVELATTEYAKANLWFSDDDELVLRFVENAEMLPFEWRSVLTILEEDEEGRLVEVPLGSEREREIRVNDYFEYRGYRFFQTNALPDRPTYSGIGVVYDPGIPIVLLGMYVIIAGTMIAFLVRPVVLAARSPAGSGAAGGSNG